MANNQENDKSSKPKTIRLQIIDNLLSSGWFSHLDMCIEMDHAEGLTGITRDSMMPDLEYYTLLMDKDEQGNQRGHLDAVMRQIVDIWSLVRRGVDIQGILDRGNGNNPIRDEFRQLLIESHVFSPGCYEEELDEFGVTESFRTYLRNSTQSLSVYRYREDGYSIFKKQPGASKSDWELYNDALQITKIQRKITPDIYYDSSDAARYGIIPDPDVISRKVKALMIKALQDELLRDTTGAVQRRLEEIEQLKKAKPAGWMNDTSETYLNAIYDGRGVIADLDLGPIIHHFGSHLMDRKEYARGHSFLKEGLDTLRETMLSGNNKAKEEYALILQNLSALHSFTGNYLLSEEEATESLEIFRNLAKVDDTYIYGVATLLYSLAGIHVKMTKLDTVEEEYDESVTIFSRLSDEEPTKYLYQLVECITSLALYYKQVGRLEESIEAFERAMPFLEKLSEKNFDDFAPQRVNAMINYASALQDYGVIDKAEEVLNESLQIIKQLDKNSPGVYKEEFSTALNNRGVLYGETGRVDLAMEDLLEAERLRRELLTEDPLAFNSRLAATLDSLANLDLNSGKSSDAIDKWTEAISLLAVYNHDGNNDFASTLGQYYFSIGLTYLVLQDKDKSIVYLSKAESVFRGLFDKDSSPKMFEDKYALTLSYLGTLYEDSEEEDKNPEEFFEKSLDVGLWFNSCVNNKNKEFLINVYCNYAPFLFRHERFEEAKKMWGEAVKLEKNEDARHPFSEQAQDLLTLVKQNILEVDHILSGETDDNSYEEEGTCSNDEPLFSQEEAHRLVESTIEKINTLRKDDINYRKNCRTLYRDSLQYSASLQDSLFLADYLSTICQFIADDYIFSPIENIAPVALRIYENALSEDNANMELRLRYIKLLSVYCRALDEYNHYDKQFKTIEKAFDLLKPIVINRKDDTECTYAALKTEILLDYIANGSPENAYEASKTMLAFYRDVSDPVKPIMCRLLIKSAIASCEHEDYYEAEGYIDEAESIMRDCDINDLANCLSLGELYTFKGRYINQSPLKWPDNYQAYSVVKSLAAFDKAHSFLERGLEYNPAAFKCKLLELYRSKLMCLKVYMSMTSKEQLNVCQDILKLIQDLTNLNEFVFTWRSVDAYIEIVETLKDIHFFDFYDNNSSLEDLEKHFKGMMSMFSHMESMLDIYKKSDPALYSDYISIIAEAKKELKKEFRAAKE